MNGAITIDPELKWAMKRLRLGRMIDGLKDRLLLANQHNLSHAEFLLTLLQDEVARRDSTAATRRATDAGLQPDMRFERWDTLSQVRFDQRVLTELRSLRFVGHAKNAVIIGPVGVGKTFVASALGHLACENRYNVVFTRADDMLRKLKQSRFDNSRDALLMQLATVDLLIIDDFALEPMSREESRDVYQLFIERSGRVATIVTSNRDTSEWIATFDDVLLAQSAVDRFVNSAFDLVMEGESYRPKLKPTISEDDPPPAEPMSKPLLTVLKRRR